ncbi:VOC family protein [Oceaniglobus trochenteri]|uniref:VOC family protein n=1 Tax=Oceaniglobus trochenteri TaxID=2763260 RepID=UPI001CFF893C|nr:VOC family protein [Oceaniglobus trochenteri]
MSETKRPRAIGINHVALEVGDIDAALEFYGQFLSFKLRSKGDTMAFIDLGDQFLALSTRKDRPRDADRHFGLVVDDAEAVRRIIKGLGIEIVSDRFLDFHDPWGNKIEIVGYPGIQFSKTDAVLNAMGAADLEKTDDARDELRKKGML